MFCHLSLWITAVHHLHNNSSDNFLTPAITVITGTIVYVLGRLVEKFWLDPIHSQNAIIEKIAGDLTFYAQYYGNPLQIGLPGDGEKLADIYRAASEEIRRDSTILVARTNSIPTYDLLSSIGFRISRENVKTAATKLIGLSNSFFKNSIPGQAVNNSNWAGEVRKLLNLDTTP